MAEVKTLTEFKQITLDDKEIYNNYKTKNIPRGCEYNFVNLFIWGKQHIAFKNNNVLIFSQFGTYKLYLYPVGTGDKKNAVDILISDAEERKIPCRINGMTEDEKAFLEENYPDLFSYKLNRNGQDYVYSIEDLADLKGKKYQSKRNHYNRFKKEHPDFHIEIIGEKNLPLIKQMADEWYEDKNKKNPEENFSSERSALEKALENYKELELEGLVLICDNKILAFTVASHLSDDTMDVHFEKAVSDIHGAYAVINCEFAKYIQKKYPQIRFLDREEDMGVEGLRKAKLSYHPHHLVVKYNSCLSEGNNDN